MQAQAGPETRTQAQLPDRQAQRRLEGRERRAAVPRRAHAELGVWAGDRARDPVAMLEASNADRLPELAPIRIGRMLESPFAFYRGSAAVMAADLAATPTTGIHVQACGDAHAANFGGFATPERNLVFDLNDFDETHPGPWEWDLKRLAASIVLAGRAAGVPDDANRAATAAAVRSYRERMDAYAGLPVLDVWYARIGAADVEASFGAQLRGRVRKALGRATGRTSESLMPKLTELVGDQRRILEQPPLVRRPFVESDRDAIRAVLEQYVDSMPEERQVLVRRFEIVDVALKVVGVGSVGTRCFVILAFARDTGEPLFLQAKEAGPSVLAGHVGVSTYPHQGQRVVVGQRLTQAASDIFLGWATGPGGRDFYFRQLRDMKLSANLERFDAGALADYAALCGWVLARAHARTGQPAVIAGYLGNSARFDDAVADFGVAYADVAERDHAALGAAVAAGRLPAERGV